MSVPRPTSAGLLRMLAVGAVVGSFLDGFHTHSHTTRYPSPWLWGMAWWTPLIFAVAYAALGAGYTFVRRSRRGLFAGRTSLVSLLVFAGLYAASGFLPVSNALKAAVLGVGGAALWAATDRQPVTLALGLAAALVGPGAEIVLVHLHAFDHLQPDLAGIPVWLPALYWASAPGAGPAMAWIGYKSFPNAPPA